MKTIAQEWIRYDTVSACALTVGVTALYILGDYPSWRYVVAMTASCLVGLILTYTLSIIPILKCRRLWNFYAYRQFILVQRRTG